MVLSHLGLGIGPLLKDMVWPKYRIAQSQMSSSPGLESPEKVSRRLIPVAWDRVHIFSQSVCSYLDRRYIVRLPLVELHRHLPPLSITPEDALMACSLILLWSCSQQRNMLGPNSDQTQL